MKVFLAGIGVAVFEWMFNGSPSRVPADEAWHGFCAWAVTAELWAALIAISLLTAVIVWLAIASHDGPTVRGALAQPVTSILGEASFAGIAAYLGIYLAARHESPWAFAFLAMSGVFLHRLSRMARAFRTVYL